MEQHLNKLTAMAEELDAIGATIFFHVKVMVLLTSLPKVVTTFVMT
jgi:hypothetical protein